MEYVAGVVSFILTLVQICFHSVKQIFLLSFPHAPIFMIAGQCINATITVKKREMEMGEGKMYWLHSLLMTGATGFSGGFLAPLLIGKQPMLYNNEYIFIILFACWYLVHNCGAMAFLESGPVKVVWTLFLGLFRTHTVVNMTMAANAAVASNKYETVALFGPVFTATFLASAGLFFPPRPDFWAMVKNGCPWALQGAFYTASLTHLMINDTNGFLGTTLRSVTGEVSIETVRLLVAVMHLSNLYGQLYVTPNFNIFDLLHYYLYILMPNIQGPKQTAAAGGSTAMKKVKSEENISLSMPLLSKERVERALESVRVAVFVVFAAYLLQSHVLQKTHISVGYSNGLVVGAPGLGRCQILPNLRECNAFHTLFTESEGSYTWAVQQSDASSSKLFKVTAKAGSGSKDGEEGGTVKVYLAEDGYVKLGTCSKALWTSSKKCPSPSSGAAGSNPDYMSLAEDGTPTVHCAADGSAFSL